MNNLDVVWYEHTTSYHYCSVINVLQACQYVRFGDMRCDASKNIVWLSRVVIVFVACFVFFAI